MSIQCACGANFIVEACDLATGRVRAVWHPLSMEWETDLNQVGKGSVILSTREISIRDVWPGLTSVYISRIAGGGASETSPVAEFAGLVVEAGASESGATVVGLESIEGYLHRRSIKNTIAFEEVPQTQLAASLVALAQPDGIPLTGVAAASTRLRDRTYEGFTRKPIGEAIEQLTQVLNGPDWELSHTRQNGAWSTEIIFRDFVGIDRGVIIQSDREASAYSLSVSMADLATWVDAIGSGDDTDTLIYTARDESGIYPQFDASPAWKDVTRLRTLRQHGDGYLEDNREPQAVPTVSLSGFVPDPADVRLGDIIDVRISYGAATFRGLARIISIAWGLDVDSPETRTLGLWPLGRASQTVLNQDPDGLNCEGCD